MGICSSKESEITGIGENGPQLRNPNEGVFVTGGIIRFSTLRNKEGEKLIPDQNIKPAGEAGFIGVLKE